VRLRSVVIFALAALPASAQVAWHWQNPLPQGNSLNDIAVVNGPAAIAVGDCGTMLRTTDAGLTWSALPRITDRNINGICFPTVIHGFMVGDSGLIMRTSDAGATWESLPSRTTRHLRAVCFPHARQFGYAVGDAGTILRTADCGDSWTDRSIPVSFAWRDVSFATDCQRRAILSYPLQS
jgi:photosystem II stability/assembly factor-like uncharacterized protein